MDFEQEHKPKNFKTQKIILAHIYYQLHVGFQAIGSLLLLATKPQCLHDGVCFSFLDLVFPYVVLGYPKSAGGN